MNISAEERHAIIESLLADFDAKTDGGKRNILFARCPYCGSSGYKFGMRIQADRTGKSFGSSHCFKCGRSCRDLKQTLTILNREELMPAETEELEEELSPELKIFEDELDDDVVEVTMPEGYKRTYRNAYLKSRGWRSDDYDYFEVGTNRGVEWKFDNYVIIPVIEDGVKVGFVGRHILSKEEIERHNSGRRSKILRYRNSTEADGNGFEKLIYNIDAVVPFVTETVIVCEGVFDVVGLNRKLELYDNEQIVPVATFGKKMSKVQLYKLQSRGVKTLVLGYDQDASETTKALAKELEQYFDVFIVNIPNSWEEKDFDEMKDWQVYQLFSEHLLTVREYNLIADV